MTNVTDDDEPCCPVCEATVCPVCLANHFADTLRPQLRKFDRLRAAYRKLDLTDECQNLTRVMFGALLSVATMRGEMCAKHRLPHLAPAKDALS